MKRRLNILCVIVVLVLSYSVFETGYYFIVGVKAGVEAGIDGNASEASQKKLMNMKYISLLPEHLSGLGDNGLTLIENAPWGVVASVTPSTNPAATG